ncbi:hypothetical protein EVAR_36032_1 [Eumeta japonica]|uniref:Uncharacterized protein n=1 Tax=Eumeta variegata TaxID=151549 RepID=A0A4C1WRS2_EUMVA|nr:hypothetical protein EVAR_36032_1 [Eumeta japonica]
MKVEKDFIKADSANLPKVDSFMIANFFASNPDFCSAEFRNVKTSVSSRQSYGDDAIGYVQLKCDHTLCTVKCRMCPEHKVRQTSYSVSMVIDEKEGVVYLTILAVSNTPKPAHPVMRQSHLAGVRMAQRVVIRRLTTRPRALEYARGRPIIVEWERGKAFGGPLSRSICPSENVPNRCVELRPIKSKQPEFENVFSIGMRSLGTAMLFSDIDPRPYCNRRRYLAPVNDYHQHWAALPS